MTIRRICIVTGSRADYGLLYWLMREIESDPDLALQLVVTGMHLSPAFGLTVDAIEADGFSIDARIDMLLAADTGVAVAKSMGLGTIGAADAFARLRPDVVVLLGDRYEMLAVAQAAMVMRIPIAHIHGGEATEGLIDEAVRHALTKMAQLHFTAAEAYGRRVVQMGEAPERVFVTGAPGLDHLERLEFLDRAALEADLGFSLAGPVFLVTYHPLTLDSERSLAGVEALIAALDRFPAARLVMTGVNADTDNDILARRLAAYAQGNSRVLLRQSLGQRRYMSLMRLAELVVGNSSSGIIEAPAQRIPTVNIGERQRGRLRAASVIDCPEDADAIAGAITMALDPAWRAALPERPSLYGQGGASARIKDILKSFPLDGLLMKRFHDLEASC